MLTFHTVYLVKESSQLKNENFMFCGLVIVLTFVKENILFHRTNKTISLFVRSNKTICRGQS